ncbi:MAG TPA: hypothetical protein VHO25_02500 [Polyangiaceae bacterium]|nr:hypothetical protein [Polyangiaceae bacterium]
MRRRAFAVCLARIVLGIALVLPTAALAQSEAVSEPLPLDFTWTAPQACPTREEVVAELTKAVDAGGKELPQLTARAVVQQDGPTWRLELFTEMDGRRGSRLLQADSCEGLARAATLVLALTLGEGLARRQAEAAAQQTSPPPQPPEPTPPAARAPVPVTRPSTATLAWAALAVGTDPLGELGPALALGLAWQPTLIQLGVRLGATLPRTSGFSGSAQQVKAFAISADLSACLVPTLQSLQLLGCLNAGIVALQAKGRGTAADSSALIPLYQLGPSAGARWLFSEHAFLNLEVLSRLFVVQPELVVEGLPQRRQIETATVEVHLGGGVRW